MHAAMMDGKESCERLKAVLVDERPGRRSELAAALGEFGCAIVAFAGFSDDLLGVLEAHDPGGRLPSPTGQPGSAAIAEHREATGRLVCACFGVGAYTVLKAIHDQALVTVEAIGDALKAGTNCGSCVPELRAFLQERLSDVA